MNQTLRLLHSDLEKKMQNIPMKQATENKFYIPSHHMTKNIKGQNLRTGDLARLKFVALKHTIRYQWFGTSLFQVQTKFR